MEQEDLGGGPPMMQVPVIPLAGAGLRIDTHPSGDRMLMIGPVAFAIALTPEMEKWLLDNIGNTSGIVLARADQLPRGAVI